MTFTRRIPLSISLWCFATLYVVGHSFCLSACSDRWNRYNSSIHIRPLITLIRVPFAKFRLYNLSNISYSSREICFTFQRVQNTICVKTFVGFIFKHSRDPPQLYHQSVPLKPPRAESLAFRCSLSFWKWIPKTYRDRLCWTVNDRTLCTFF